MGKLKKGINDLQTKYPDLAKQFDIEANNGITPDQISAHCNKSFFWRCDKGHLFESTPDKRIRGDGCTICSNRKLLVGYNDLETKCPDLAADWNYDLNKGTPKNYTFRSKSFAHWKCRICGYEWEGRISNRVDSKYHLCSRCTAAKRGEEKHKTMLKRSGGITNALLLQEWDYEKNNKGPNEYTPKSGEEVYWICSKCGYRYRAKILNRANGRGCACCAGKVVVAGVNDLATTHPKLAAEWHPTKNGVLKPTDVSHGMDTHVWWICQEGHEYQADILHRSAGTNCPRCNSGRQTSFAEQAVYYYIKQIFPDAVNRYKKIFKNGMELDIYIPSIKLGIEYDGIAWHKAEKIEREIIKYEICKAYGIRLIRLMEKPPENGMLLTADKSISSGDGPLYEKKNLEKVIRFLMDEIDPESNMWTRKNMTAFHSRVDINLDRDELVIRNYMTKTKGSFAERFPELAKEWHPTKNAPVTPDKIKPFASFHAWWICPKCGKEYPASVGHRSYGTGCPDCGKKKSVRHCYKPVVMIDPITHEIIEEFESITEAGKEIGTSSSNITSVCKGTRKIAGGYIWKYKE